MEFARACGACSGSPCAGRTSSTTTWTTSSVSTSTSASSSSSRVEATRRSAREALRRLGGDLNETRDRLHHSADRRERTMAMHERLEELWQDVRYAARGLVRRPGSPCDRDPHARRRHRREHRHLQRSECDDVPAAAVPRSGPVDERQLRGSWPRWPAGPHRPALVVDEVPHVPGRPEQVPGTRALGAGELQHHGRRRRTAERRVGELALPRDTRSPAGDGSRIRGRRRRPLRRSARC